MSGVELDDLDSRRFLAFVELVYLTGVPTGRWQAARESMEDDGYAMLCKLSPEYQRRTWGMSRKARAGLAAARALSNERAQQR